jgi:hypothetical protein
MKSIRELVSEIAKREGKRSQAKIGEVREIVGCMSDLLYEMPGVYQLLAVNGVKRAKKKKK